MEVNGVTSYTVNSDDLLQEDEDVLEKLACEIAMKMYEGNVNRHVVHDSIITAVRIGMYEADVCYALDDKPLI